MPKIKIALIEDDEILSKVINEELLEAGFIVERAFNGEEGLKLVASMKPNLILCDIIMPKKGGFEVLEELKRSPATRDIPVVILTMLGSDDDIKKGLKLGANDYIVKSQHAVSEIVDKVRQFFGEETHPEAEQPKKEKKSSSAETGEDEDEDEEGEGEEKKEKETS